MTSLAAIGEPVKLTAFVVSSEREGNAKAIMNQRNSRNITHSVASDNYADSRRVNVAPHATSGRPSYSWRRVSVNTNFTWTDDTPWNTSGTQFRRHRAVIDGGATWRLTDRLSTFLRVRNLANAPLLIMEQVGANTAAIQRYEVHGMASTFGIKAMF